MFWPQCDLDWIFQPQAMSDASLKYFNITPEIPLFLIFTMDFRWTVGFALNCIRQQTWKLGSNFAFAWDSKEICFVYQKFVAKSTPLGMSNEGADIDGATGFARPVFVLQLCVAKSSKSDGFQEDDDKSSVSVSTGRNHLVIQRSKSTLHPSARWANPLLRL